MSIKKIFIFVLCGIMLYAGGFCLYYGFEDLERAGDRYVGMNESDLPNISHGGKATAQLYQQVGLIGTEKFQPEIFGIPMGKPTEWHFYLVPLNYEEDPEKHKYYIVCVSDPDSIATMESIWIGSPQPETGEPFVIKGVSKEMELGWKDKVLNVLMSRTYLVGIDGFFEHPLITYYRNRIIPWVVYEQNSVSEYISAFIVGGVLCVVAVGLAVLMIVRIRREKNWY